MDLQNVGKIVLLIGGGLVLLGGALLLLGRIFPGFGSLPGDIRIQTERVSCFFPLVSMCLLSVIATIVLNIIIRLANRQ